MNLTSSAIERVGTFSSSQGYKLVKSGRTNAFSAQGITYINSICNQLILGRSTETESSSRPTSWGNLCEAFAFEFTLPISYQLVSSKRLVHPEITMWTGAPDLIIENSVVGDVKCPYSLDVLCNKIRSFSSLEGYKEDFPEDYWQHVSNSILLEKNGYGEIEEAEAVIFCPYKSQLDDIKKFADNLDDYKLQRQVQWLTFCDDEEIPHIPDGCKIKNLTRYRFKIPKEDKEILTDRIKLAIEEANKLYKEYLKTYQA